MLFLYLIIYLKSSVALLISSDDRLPTRNLTCQHDFTLSTTLLSDCEACLITSRNYIIETKLSMTGSGPAGFSHTCLKVNEVEAYHENLIRECRYFPRTSLSGYDDFCIASPYSYIRGSYRACLCLTNACNLNYAKCMQQINSVTTRKSSIFTNKIVELTNSINCFQSSNYNEQEKTFSDSTSLCSPNDTNCQNYLLKNGVLCMISIDQENQTTRQSLVPSVYSSYLLKYKTEYCSSFSTTPTSIYFSQCKQNDVACMCMFDGCNKDLETCQTNHAISNNYCVVLFLFIVLWNIYNCK